MRRRAILLIAGLVLAAFGLGLAIGSRVGRRSRVYDDTAAPEQADGAPSVQQAAKVPSAAAAPGMPACVDTRNAGTLVGKSGCVAGLVLRVYAARSGNTFLDFCPDYRACPFTSVVFAADKSSFGDLGSLQGKRVEIRGKVVSYNGHAEIILHEARQLRGAP